MKITFRTDSSLQIGSGHVMRCLNLADSLKNNGLQVTFSCIEHEGNLLSRIRDRGYIVNVMPPGKGSIKDEELPYLYWLGKTEKEDAEEFCRLNKLADVVIVDHYALGSIWEQYVKNTLHCVIIAIDDLVRDHSANVVFDQTLNRDPSEYTCQNRAFTGIKYSILSPDFSRYREHALDRSSLSTPPRVLVSFGGVDLPNASLAVVKELVKDTKFHITVLLSKISPSYAEVVSFCNQHSQVKHLDFVTHMAELMHHHDIAIGAPGGSSWERMCMGLPTVLIPIAENQKNNCIALAQSGVAVSISLDTIDTKLSSAIEELMCDWNGFRNRAIKLCDGSGVYRITNEILRLGESDIKPNSVDLVPAQLADVDLVYQWQILPETRKYALNSSPPSYAEHCSWMQSKLDSPSDHFFLIKGYVSEDRYGVVRIDRIKQSSYLVSIFLDPKFHGQGFALAALQQLDCYFPNYTLHATILPENAASQRLFERAGYRKISDEKFIRKPIW